MEKPINLVESAIAPKPNGHYSQAVVFGNLIFTSAQLGFIPGSKTLPATLTEQTENCLLHIQNILETANSNLARILKMTIYVTDITNWEKVNAVYTRKMGTHKPARAVIAVNGLHLGAVVGMEAIAAYC